MSAREFRLRLRLYLVWVGCGAAVTGLEGLSLPEPIRAWVNFALGIAIAISGGWRMFIDKSTVVEK